MKDGAYAKGVNSVLPSMTYPSHTTIVTGVWPAKHGIYYNGMYEPNGSTGKIYWNDSSIKVPTLWSVARAKGLKTAALYWPVSADAPVDYNIPDIGSLGEEARLKYSKPEGFVAEIKHNLFHDSTRIDHGHDHNIASIAAYIMKKDQPNLMAIHLFGLDHYSHEEGRDGPKVRAAVADADSSVGIIVRALKDAGIWDNTLFIVTGDHGFVTVTSSVNPNVWLAKEGLITDIKKDEWKAQFFSVGGSTFLYLKDPKDTKTLAQVKTILSQVPAEQKKFFRIIDRAQLDKIGGNPEVALVLSGENGAAFGNATTGEAISSRKTGGSHGYFPDFKDIQTGFIANGPGVKKGGVINEMNVRDIAGVVARFLGLSMATDGKEPVGLMAK